MYKLSVPMMNRSLTANTRPIYLDQCRKAGVDRVFLVPETNFGTAEPISASALSALRENLAFFENAGIEGAIWVGSTIGHGGLAHESGGTAATLQTLVNTNGDALTGTFCPLDEQFQKQIAAGFSALATTGASLILIDDDFRLCQHGPAPCCLCDLHLARIRALLGEEISREALVTQVFSDQPNRYRAAYLQAQGDSLKALARVMRDAVDRIDPEIGLALCSCHSIWDMDGTDPLELTEILCGKHPPVLRLHGAPYWATHGGKSLPCTLEIARMFASFCHGKDIELLTENDSYPRPRYHTPAATMELHDAVLRADQGHSGVLKYLFDYCASPQLETGYLDRHCADLEALRKTETFFEGTASQGVRVEIASHPLATADLSLTLPSDQSPFPVAGTLLTQNGIPTTYTGAGICCAVFGENVRTLDESALHKGLILDAAAAILLTEQGLDVGLETVALRKAQKDVRVGFLQNGDRTERTLVWGGDCRLLCAPLCKDAVPLLYAEVGTQLLPLCYRYENAQGQRFVVWLFNASYLAHNSDLLRGYLQQRALKEGIEWLSRKPLAVYCEGNHPDLYLLTAQKGETLSVLLANCFADKVLSPVLTLDRAYNTVEFVNCRGRLEGNKVYLEDLEAYGFCAIRIMK